MDISSKGSRPRPPIPMCVDCEHFRGARVGKCDAFPDQIPGAIWGGQVRHDKPFPGDGKIQFEPRAVEQFLTVEEFAKLLNVDPKTIYRALWSNRLPAYKVGRAWRISRKDVEYFRK